MSENTNKLSYDPSMVSAPVTLQDTYMYAQLVEMRAIRIALQNLVKLNTPVETELTVTRERKRG